MFRWLFSLALLSLTLCTCLAQTPVAPSDSAAQPPATPSTTSDSAAKNSSPKKVWTNENLADAGGKVSVVGDSRNQKYTMTPSKPADPATVAQIRKDLQKLQEQLESVKQQLSSFREFQEGEPITKGSDEIQKGYTRMPVDQQMSVLQEKKRKLETQIDALLDEARKKGITPGQLR